MNLWTKDCVSVKATIGIVGAVLAVISLLSGYWEYRALYPAGKAETVIVEGNQIRPVSELRQNAHPSSIACDPRHMAFNQAAVSAEYAERRADLKARWESGELSDQEYMELSDIECFIESRRGDMTPFQQLFLDTLMRPPSAGDGHAARKVSKVLVTANARDLLPMGRDAPSLAQIALDGPRAIMLGASALLLTAGLAGVLLGRDKRRAAEQSGTDSDERESHTV
jgi:hypothetical protein